MVDENDAMIDLADIDLNINDEEKEEGGEAFMSMLHRFVSSSSHSVVLHLLWR